MFNDELGPFFLFVQILSIFFWQLLRYWIIAWTFKITLIIFMNECVLDGSLKNASLHSLNKLFVSKWIFHMRALVYHQYYELRVANIKFIIFIHTDGHNIFVRTGALALVSYNPGEYTNLTQTIPRFHIRETHIIWCAVSPLPRWAHENMFPTIIIVVYWDALSCKITAIYWCHNNKRLSTHTKPTHIRQICKGHMAWPNAVLWCNDVI